MQWAVLSLALIVFMLLPAAMLAQDSESVLYSFCFLSSCADGRTAEGTLVFDAHGNLYGTTGAGGTGTFGAGNGIVYELSPPAGGGPWTETVLYNFCSLAQCQDGGLPRAGVIFDAQDHLYGTTHNGGSINTGVAFELSPPAGGSGPWTETVLYNFCSVYPCQDGGNPNAGLIFDSHGNLYGTTTDGGGTTGEGVVFELSPDGHGSWTYTVLYAFCLSDCHDGQQPSPGSLIFDSAGNLYGTTEAGGTGGGIVFELTPPAGGTGPWTETILHDFTIGGLGGGDPRSGLVFDSQGNLYGTTLNGGTDSSGGVAYELSPPAGGQGPWIETVLQNFCFQCLIGYQPLAGLTLDARGNLVGTANSGGTNNHGVAYELSPPPGGQGHWTETVLYNFCPLYPCPDGSSPQANLILDSAGNVYGTTSDGGTGEFHDEGTIFELSSHLVPTTTVLTSTPNPSHEGQMVTMTGTVHAQDGSIPTGTVWFESNGVAIGSDTLNSSGVAVVLYAGLSTGTDNLTAVYQGSGTLAGSTSNVVMQVVQPAISMTLVTSSPNPSTFGDVVTITATVSPAGPPAPTGSVSFTSNGTTISGCTAVPLSLSLIAVCTTSTLLVGTDEIVAAYSGDANYSGSSGRLSQLVNPTPVALQFVGVAPCRLVDTRQTGGPIPGGTARDFPVPQEGGCNIPATASAYSLNVTLIPPTGQPVGFLSIYPTGQARPNVSTMNSYDGRFKANAAIVPSGNRGAVSVYVSDLANVVLDINGYFQPVSGSTLAFYPLAPCRVADTRGQSGDLGGPYLLAGVTRVLPILESACGIPATAQAYSFNFTSIPRSGPVYVFTAWPDGLAKPGTSTLNAPTGTVVANAGIVPAGASGAIDVWASNDSDLLIDVDGYFAPAGTGGLSLYSVVPCRVFDTRTVGAGSPFTGVLRPPVDVVGSVCGPPSAAQAYVFNATIVPAAGPVYFLTLWPDGDRQPNASTLNSYDGAVTSNAAIVPTTNGKIDADAAGLTQLILDISSYFAP